MYPEAALGLFFTADHAIKQSRGHALELFISRGRIEIECLGVLRCCELDSVRIDQGRYKIKLTATEYAETFNLDPTTAYEQLKSVSTTLLDRMIRREEQTKRGFRVHLDHWVSGITYH